MKHTGLPIFYVTTLCLLAACHSVQTQTTSSQSIYSEAPPVMSIRAQQPTPSATPAGDAPLQPAPLPQTTPRTTPEAANLPARPAAPKFSYNNVNIREPYIAITFDDGPSPELTPKLLDMLKARGVKATFYVVGTSSTAHPEILRRMVAEGHEIGNHTWNHPALPKLGAAGVKSQMDKTTAAIVAAVGEIPKTMRPPYGATNASLNRRLNEEFGMKVIMWAVDPLDWKYRNSERVANEIITKTKPGDIILAHDIHASTVNAMPKTLDTLLAKGFKFVTVSELLAMDEAPLPAATPSPSAVSANP